MLTHRQPTATPPRCRICASPASTRHIGSQLTDLSPLVEACERIVLLVDQLAAEGIALKHIDLGGGIGIVYDNESVPI